MAKKVGSVYAEIRADIKKLQQDFDKAHQVTQTSAKKIQDTLDRGINFNKASDSLARFQKLMTIGFAGVGLQKVASSFIETAASFEMMRVKLEALEGSRGTRLFEALNKMALELPISTKDVVQGFVTMQAMGLEPTRRQMLILSDVAAVLGDDVFGRVVLQLGQMSAKGKITAQDLNIMAEAGINVRKILSESFGKTVEELQESGIEISKVTDAIFEGMNKKFGGSSEKMMNTWRGVTELMKSNWIEIERVVANAGIFQFLKEEIKGVSDGLREWLEVNRENIKQDLPGYVDRVRVALATAKGQLESLWKILTYDPAIIEFGLLGLLVGGKKGAVLAGGAAHLANIPGMLVEASILAKEGYVNVSDIVWADYKELEKIVEKGRKLKSAGPPGPLALLPSHGISLLPAHGEFKKTGEQLSADADGWRKRWEEDWNVWGFKISGNYAPDPAKTKEQLEKIESETKKFQADSAKAVMSNFDFERFKIDAQLKEYKKYITDKNALDSWYHNELMAIKIKEMVSEADRMKEPQSERIARTRIEREKEFADEENRLWAVNAQAENDRLMDKVAKYEKTHKNLVELTERTAEAMQENFSNLFFDAMTGKLKTLEDYARAIFESIARMASDLLSQQATRALFGSDLKGGGLLSQFFGTSGADLAINTPGAFAAAQPFHSGGSVGSSGGAIRSIPASYYHSAPRLHNGLMPDEYPAIMQRGETVFPKGASPSGGGGSYYFITAMDTQSIRDSLRRSGAVPMLAEENIRANGGLRKAIQTRAR